jgi:hypothetical protein
MASIAVNPGTLGRVPLNLLARSAVEVGLNFKVPAETAVGETIDLDVVQRDSRNNIVGGVAVQVRVRKK